MKNKICTVIFIAGLAALVFLCHKSGEALKVRISEGHETAGEAVNEKILVVVDAGHGGIDGGKIGINGAEEKDVNLKIALEIQTFLNDAGLEVKMTRTEDDRLGETQAEDLKKRVELMNNSGAEIAVSIHQNSYHQEEVNGAQVFYYSDSKEGKAAAEIIQEKLNEMGEGSKKQARGNRTYYILKNTEIPVIIVESGFLSNYEEAEKLITEDYQRKIAGTVADGVAEYLETR